MDNLSHIERFCARLRLHALAHNRPFLAHLLEMVVLESRARPDLPISDLKDIATQMREHPRSNNTAIVNGHRWSRSLLVPDRKS